MRQGSDRPPPGQGAARGIAAMLFAFVLFSLLNVQVKLLTAHYSSGQIAFFRNLFALPVMAVVVWAAGGLRVLRTQRLAGHALRAGVGLVSMYLAFQSFAMLPLAEAMALSFSAPLFLTALSVPLLAEPVGRWRWAAVMIGFIGVVIMLKPGAGVISPGAVVALGSAVTYALAMVCIRQLTASESTIAITAWFATFATLFSALPLPWLWQPVLSEDWSRLLLLGLTGAVAQYFLSLAYALAPAAVVGPYQYSLLLWGTLFGWLLWGEVPGSEIWTGSALVIGSGLLILYRESRRTAPGSRQPVTETPPVE